MAEERSNDPAAEVDRIADEFEAAWKEGVAPAVQEYVARGSPGIRQALLEELVRVDISCRRMRGQIKPLEEYLAEFPELAKGGIASELRALHKAASESAEGTRTATAPGPVQEMPVPTRIGSYRILRRLGGGTFGVVFLAEQRRPRRPVALKVLRSGAMDARQLQRFEQEAEALGRLDHPDIAQVYEAGWDESGAAAQPYLAMEFVDGVTLDSYVRARSIDRRGIVTLIRRVASAVQYAHQRGIIHRDLKPANILVTSDGQPRLLDFGVAKFLQTDDDSPLVSLSGEVVGTPAYMAPEQARGEADHVETRTDVYALGAVLFYLLLNRHAHDMTGSAIRCLQRVASVEPLRPRSVDPRLDADLEAVLVKAMAPEPERRYASAAELAADLQRYLDGEPLMARGQTTLYFLQKKLRRHWARVAAVAAVLVLLAAGVVLYIVSINTERARANAARLLADRQRQVADANATRAGEQRSVALQAVNDLVFTAQRELSDSLVPAATRQRLIDAAMSGLQRVTEDGRATDARTDRTLASALLLVGDIRASDGLYDRACEAYQQALDRFARLAELEGASVRARRDLVIVRTRLGTAQLQRGDLATAGDQLRSAQATLDELQRLGLADSHWPRDQWAVLLALADWRMERGEPAEALAILQRALESAGITPRDRSSTLKRLASARLADRSSPQRLEEVRGLLDETIKLDRALVSQSPEDGRARRELAEGLRRWAEWALRQQRYEPGETALREAITITEDLTTRSGGRADLRVELAGLHYLAGEYATALQRPAEAKEHYLAVEQIAAALQESGAAPQGLRRIVELTRGRNRGATTGATRP